MGGGCTEVALKIMNDWKWTEIQNKIIESGYKIMYKSRVFSFQTQLHRIKTRRPCAISIVGNLLP